MKIIFLPGMDGTGLLFRPLLPLIPGPSEIITFPSAPPQTYQSIYTHIKARLPTEDFYLVAESFSGPIAARLASDNVAHLKGIIFVATFLSCPCKILVRLARRLPFIILLNMPFSTYIIRKFFIGPDFPITLFHQAMAKVSNRDLKHRLATLESLVDNPNTIYPPLKALYLRAENDVFISRKHTDEYIRAFPNIAITDIPGPHFLLQSRPNECATLINTFVHS